MGDNAAPQNQMSSGAQLVSGGRDADLTAPDFYSPAPIVGSQKSDPVTDFQNTYYSQGGQLLNPTYQGTPIYTPQPAPAMFAPYQPSNFYQSPSFQGVNSYLNTPAPIITPPVIPPAPATPTMSGGFSKSQAGVNQVVGSVAKSPSAAVSSPVTAATQPASDPTAGGGQSFSQDAKKDADGKTGVQDNSIVNTIFGKDSPLLKQLLGAAGAMVVDRAIKTPAYPDVSSAAQSIMRAGPQTPAGQIADERLLQYLNEGPKLTPISKEYIDSISKMFDDELSDQLKSIDTKLNAAGAGGFGGGSGDAQYLKAQLVNKYSMEKMFYIQKLLTEQGRADIERYYNTLNKVYGVSHEEMKYLAGLEVNELAAQFQIDYKDAEELKATLGQMLHEMTMSDQDRAAARLGEYGDRILAAMTPSMSPTAAAQTAGGVR